MKNCSSKKFIEYRKKVFGEIFSGKENMENLGQNFLRVVGKAIISMLKQIPILGAPIEVADDVGQEVQNIIAEQDMHKIEDRVRQLEEASECSAEVVKKIVLEVFAEIKQKGNDKGLQKQSLSNKESLINKDRARALSIEMVEAVTDIMVAMPSNIKQKVAATLRHARKNGTSPSTALPLAAETSTPSEREQFYLGLIPRRRPRYRVGNEVPYKLGWIMEELLGIGGFGEVWKIREEETNMLQAIKLCLEPSYQELWKHEARTITKLKGIGHHANIVEVLDLQLKKDPYWIMLEYIEGGTLESYLRSFGGPIPLERALQLFEQICQGMADAHKLGIVHRDLKPGNILLSKEGIAKITDFGIGKIIAHETCKESSQKQANTLTLRGYGTLRYMSPEQQQLFDPDTSDDVYSLAMVLYDMLVGNSRESGQMYKSVLRKLSKKPSLELIDIMERCLGEIREYRISHAGVLLEEIQRINGGGISKNSTQIEKFEQVNKNPKSAEQDKKLVEAETEIAKQKAEIERIQKELTQLTEQKKAELARQKEIELVEQKKAELAKQKEELAQLAEQKKAELAKQKKELAELTQTKTKSSIPGLTFLSKKTYTCGGITNTVEEYRHDQTGMEFALIPGGSFDMGSNESNNEKPVHKVTLSPYLISKTEVTQDVWQKIMGNNPSNFKEGDNYPVEYVSWNDCQEFCKKTGLQLPTEAQWENACRAGTTTKWYFGDNEKELGEYAWYEKNSGGGLFSIGRTHPVAQKKPNAFGLYDMMGNVWEWCEDWYGTYSSSAATDPVGPNTGSGRVGRGGSWFNTADYCRASYRFRCAPSCRYNDLGFRVVVFLKP